MNTKTIGIVVATGITAGPATMEDMLVSSYRTR